MIAVIRTRRRQGFGRASKIRVVPRNFSALEKLSGFFMTKKRILSGITPSGDGMLHIGNYLGAVRQFLEFQKKYDCFYFIADLHALTTVQTKERMQQNVENLVLNYLALGINPEKVTFYRQSDISKHTELQSILNNVAPLGLIRRCHAYKDKLQKDEGEEEVNMGLFCYPILMAADILLYKPDLIPVGKDQQQHVEITRDIAQRFNKIYGKVFKLPKAYIPEEVAVIIGTDGQRKMSKSLGNYIGIFESEEEIKKQVMDCFTDPKRIHVDDPGHVEGNPVFVYHRLLNDNKKEVADLEERYKKGRIGDVEVKEKLFVALMRKFGPARKKYQELKASPETVRNILKEGTLKAKKIAETTIKEVKEAIGIKNKYSFE